LTTGDRIAVPALLGPTAAGKSDIAINVCERLGLELLSCDSRQIYRYLDIGTAKPSESDRARVPHWMIDIVDPSERFSAFKFARQAETIIRKLAARGKGVLLCGGTGLYFQALCKGLAPTIPEDPELRRTYLEMAKEHGLSAVYGELENVDPVSAASSHPSNLVRNIRALEVFAATGKPLSGLKALAAGPSDMVFDVMTLIPDRDILYPRINARIDAMMSRGLLDEFMSLLRRGYSQASPGLNSVGYREFFAFKNGLSSLDQTIALIKQNSRHYAKRQITWFRRQVESYCVASTLHATDEITHRIERFLR